MSEATRRFLATLKQDAKDKDFPQSMEEVLQRARKRHKAIVLSPHWFLNTHPDEDVELIRRELGWEYPDLSYPARTTNCSLNFLSMDLSLKHQGCSEEGRGQERIRADRNDELLEDFMPGRWGNQPEVGHRLGDSPPRQRSLQGIASWPCASMSMFIPPGSSPGVFPQGICQPLRWGRHRALGLGARASGPAGVDD